MQRYHIAGQLLDLADVRYLRHEYQNVDPRIRILRDLLSDHLPCTAIDEVRIGGHGAEIPNDMRPG